MSQWQGFDQRKICPRCGEYETHLHQIRQRSAQRILLTLVGVTLGSSILAGVIVSRLLQGEMPPIGPTVTLLMLAGMFTFNRQLRTTLTEDVEYVLDHIFAKRGLKKDENTGQVLGYYLYCTKCEFKWQFSTEEWELAGQQQLEYPGASLYNSDDNKRFEQFKQKTSTQNKVTFLIVTILTLVATGGLILFGIFWSFIHPEYFFLPIAGGFAFLVAILVLLGVGSKVL